MFDPVSTGAMAQKAFKGNKEGRTVETMFDPRANKQFFEGPDAARKRLIDPLDLSTKFTGKDINQKLKKSSPSYGAIDEIGNIADQRYEKAQGYNKGLDAADQEYYDRMQNAGQGYIGSLGAATGKYKGQIEGLMGEARTQADDATKVYSGTLQPKLQGMLESDYKEAYGPGVMSLQEAGDPNNKTAMAVRELYNKEAAGTQQQGLASSGVLGALGAQNAATAFGQNGPMSVGQQQALFAASQGQAGQAFARAQQQMNNLRQQGLLQGFAESDKQYQRGERAKGRAKDAATQLSDEEGKYLQKQQGLRTEMGRGAADIMGIDAGMAQAHKDHGEGMASIGKSNKYGSAARGMGAEDARFGTQIGMQTARASIGNAQAAGQSGMLGGLGQLGGTVLGGYFGGPAGASAGGAAGQQVGAAQGGQQQAQYQGPTYGQASGYQDPNSGYGYNPRGYGGYASRGGSAYG